MVTNGTAKFSFQKDEDEGLRLQDRKTDFKSPYFNLLHKL